MKTIDERERCDTRSVVIKWIIVIAKCNWDSKGCH